ncbi:MAG TPA: GNAT family N-acetyltransferase [Thermoanaerobaculia bacterium]|nr:GNAT family N-acetyltransferase [Thermoanaerobaculia bacterium]
MRFQPTFRPPEKGEGQEAGTLVLRTGGQLPLWRALPEDAQMLAAFLARLPDEERREVSASLRLDPGEVGEFLRRLTEGGSGEAFFAGGDGGGDQVVAFGAYRTLEGEDAAAITLAVSPERRQQGLATLLLERLAVLAAQRGVARLVGVARQENEPLLEVFRQGGFASEEERRGGLVRLTLDTRSAEAAEGRDGVGSRVFATASLRPIFYPASVAVVGASREEGSVGRSILDALVAGGFHGPVFPVNPKASFVGSIKAYPSLPAIGEPVDLAVVAVPARAVRAVVEECAQVGVRGLVVITAGFAETGEPGRQLQDELLAAVRGHGMRMVGPNCLGMMHTDPEVRLNASFAPQMPPFGSVALCSQSGALGIAIIALARRLGLGLSSFVSVGNKADISGNDLLEYWEEDGNTEVVLFYLESFGNPRRFARIARRVGRRKPIVVVKAGRTQAGGRAASSHTAALAAAETAVDALFAQTGIIRADTLEEMFDVARALTDQPLPRGRRVAVVTNAGGPAILCVDALEAAGLEVRPLSDATRDTLRGLLPAAASTTNPVDMIASATPETYRRVVEVVLADEEVDALVAINTPVAMYPTERVGRAILAGVEAARQRGGAAKPVFASIVGGEEPVYVLTGESGERIPVYTFPEAIGRLLGAAAGYAEWRRADPGVFPELPGLDLEAARRICTRALEARGEGWLSAAESRDLLAAAGLQLARGGVAGTADEAASIADDVGYPVAVKLASSEIVHKTEVGGVALGLEDAAAVREAFAAIEERLRREGRREAMEGVLVQPMIAGSAEVMIGAQLDPVFGPLIAFGLGGIHVEILRDVAFRVSPLTDRDAARMVREIRGFRLLEGYRGHPPGDVAALEEALLRVSRLVESAPEIAELDLNPIFACEPGDGYRVVDARVRVAPPKR